MKPYSFSLNERAAVFFSSLKTTERRELLDEFRRQSGHPSEHPDLILRSHAERDLLVRAFRRWHITYWVDHAMREIRITDLKKVIVPD